MELPDSGYLSPQDLRAVFNGCGLIGRWERGELTVVVLKRHMPAISNAQPAGTVSVTEEWRDPDHGDARVARVHYYERPTGRSLPDPKWLSLDGRVFRLAPPAE